MTRLNKEYSSSALLASHCISLVCFANFRLFFVYYSYKMSWAVDSLVPQTTFPSISYWHHSPEMVAPFVWNGDFVTGLVRSVTNRPNVSELLLAIGTTEFFRFSTLHNGKLILRHDRAKMMFSRKAPTNLNCLTRSAYRWVLLNEPSE